MQKTRKSFGVFTMLSEERRKQEIRMKLLNDILSGPRRILMKIENIPQMENLKSVYLTALF